MSKNWTEGPWVVMNGCDIYGPLGGDSGDGCKCDDSDGWLVAVVEPHESFVDGELVEHGLDCVKANQNLISAAPALYAALDKLLDAIDSCTELTPELLRSCESILSKARGEK